VTGTLPEQNRDGKEGRCPGFGPGGRFEIHNGRIPIENGRRNIIITRRAMICMAHWEGVMESPEDYRNYARECIDRRRIE
jgi:hypothetical protein